ncbi:hypothetical protein L3X38_013131 [Prunus dulcis]|uniref:Uncharacterized protein n=1 Tax=Prunus dulcis TaxID=3755 RepID=A0AAD4WKW7_PRUDU|nr:hypothetical protein L3X38_013131 [Prunus dulcis]
MAFHTRSNSFTSRPHPIVQEVDEHLCSWMFVAVPRMPCCKPRNAYRTFNRSCEEREEVNLEHSLRVACEEETEANEFAQVDAPLQSFTKTRKSDHKNADNQLDNLESCIQDQEEQLHCLFRQLIKTRVTLLNILNH